MKPSKLYAQAALLLTAVAAFGVTGYLGYRFIRDVSSSAEHIRSQVEPPVSGQVAVNSETLSAGQGSSAAVAFDPVQPPSAGISSGQDVVVGAGELVYQNGLPLVRMKLVNQGGFTASGLFVSFALYLDNANDAVAKVIGVPVPLATPLAAGAETVVSVPIDGADWRTPTVARAQKRRVLAQVVGVSDGDRDHVDYPQTGAGVFLSQTQNNWTHPAAASAAVQEIPLQEIRPGPAPSPNIAVQSEGEMPAQEPQELSLEEAKDLLHPEQPVGEPRILSVEVHEYGQDDAPAP